MKNEVKILKLSNGEDVIGTITSRDDKVIRLKFPWRVVMMPPDGPNSKHSVALIPFNLYSDDEEVNFYIHNLMCTPVTPREDFLNHYRQQSGNGGSLLLPKKPSLIV